jgi:hypothetical protein
VVYAYCDCLGQDIEKALCLVPGVNHAKRSVAISLIVIVLGMTGKGLLWSVGTLG